MKKFNIDKLNNLRIHELRDIARTVGVKSPTSMKKQDIIEQMLLILSGEHEPYVNTTKQGRPAKSLKKLEEVVDLFMPDLNKQTEKVENYTSETGDSDGFEFFVNSPEISFNEDVNLQEKVDGYLDLQNGAYGIVRVQGILPHDNDVFLHIYSVKSLNLKNGDHVEGLVKQVQKDRQRVMVSVLKVNGVLLQDHKPTAINFDQERYGNLTTPIKFNNDLVESKNVKKGLSSIMEGSGTLFLGKLPISYSRLKVITQVFKGSEYLVYVVNFNARLEEYGQIQENIEFYNFNFSLNEKEITTGFNLVLEKAKRQVEHGKKVILIVNKMSTLVKSINNLNSNEYVNYLKIQTVQKVKNIAMCAKQLQNNSSLTLMVFEVKNIELYLQEFIEYEAINFFNNVIGLNVQDGEIEFEDNILN